MPDNGSFLRTSRTILRKETPHVRFLAVASHDDKFQHLGEEVSVAITSGARCLIWVSDANQAARVEQHLWQFETSSFMPHAIWPCSLVLHPIIISWQPLVLPNVTDLFVLHPHPSDVLSMFSWMLEYQNILEFADLSDKHLQTQSRNRFKTWRQHHIQPSYQKSTALEKPEASPTALEKPEPSSTSPAPKVTPAPESPLPPEVPEESYHEGPPMEEPPMEEPPAFLFDEPSYPYE